jgi:hypothetical protein
LNGLDATADEDERTVSSKCCIHHSSLQPQNEYSINETRIDSAKSQDCNTSNNSRLTEQQTLDRELVEARGGEKPH